MSLKNGSAPTSCRRHGTAYELEIQGNLTFDAFMSFVHNRAYSQEHEYTAEEKNSLTPDDVVRWMNVKTFGIKDPPIDANPVYARSSPFGILEESDFIFYA